MQTPARKRQKHTKYILRSNSFNRRESIPKRVYAAKSEEKKMIVSDELVNNQSKAGIFVGYETSSQNMWEVSHSNNRGKPISTHTTLLNTKSWKWKKTHNNASKNCIEAYTNY